MLGKTERLVILIIALGVFIAVGLALRLPALPANPWEESPDEAPGAGESVAAQPEPVVIWVHVVGEVRNPGVYSLPEGARAMRAVEAAGGLTAVADSAGVNLARVLNDGEQLYIPKRGEETGVAGSGGSAAAPGKVDVNRADAVALQSIPGIGPTLASRIIAYRTVNGPFRTAQDLLQVSGIGQKTLEQIKPYIIIR
ncbi:MAG: helix-hairpin-helix domain-containing protein [Bacillota bacterium]